jgi:UDP-N-acetylglucosamine 1-carboxyvinyltransferase
MAGLLSQEETIISGLPYLDRGYENLTGKLQALGANVTRQLKDGSKAKEKTTQLLQTQSAPAVN